MFLKNYFARVMEEGDKGMAAGTAAQVADPAERPPAAPAPAVPPQPGATSVLNPPSDPAPATTPADWPDDWAAKFAGDDEKLLKRAQRYQSPREVFQALIAAQNKISSGEFKSALPENATPEQLAKWRTDNGIPETPDKYNLNFDNGIVIGEEDKPFVDNFLKHAHENNLTEKQAKAVIAFHYQDMERQAEETAKIDNQDMQKTQDELNAEWGANYRRNINAIEGLLQFFPENVRDSLKGGRLPDGTGIFNNPDIVRAFASIALDLNPAGVVTPGGNENSLQTIENRIDEIQKVMRTDRRAYNSDPKMQAELKSLIEAQSKISKRIT